MKSKNSLIIFLRVPRKKIKKAAKKRKRRRKLLKYFIFKSRNANYAQTVLTTM